MGRSGGRHKKILNSRTGTGKSQAQKKESDSDRFQIYTSKREQTSTLNDILAANGPLQNPEALPADSSLFFRLSIKDMFGARQVVSPEGDHAKETGFEEKDEDWDFIRPFLTHIKENHPEAVQEMQVMIDLDSTIFPLDRAMREKGIDVEIISVEDWSSSGDTIGDAIMIHFGRADLLHEKDLDEEQLQEKIQILGDFFRELHEDEELMKRAGVYRYAPQMIHLMRKQGIKVHILTHRAPTAALSTQIWLEEMGIEYDFFECAESGDLDKIDYCKKHKIPLLFDDKPKTITDAEDAGIEALSLKWPYSKKALEEAGGDEAHCWMEMTHIALDHIERIVSEKTGQDPKDYDQKTLDLPKGKEKSFLRRNVEKSFD